MADELFRPAPAGLAGATSFDAGLRAHMQRVFNYMAGGLGLTGLIAFVVANTGLANIIFGTPLRWVAMLLPFIFVMYLQLKVQSISAARAQTMFWLFCGAMGLSMAAIFLVFTGASVARAFFITAATFGAMSLYGYTTRRDLTSMGAFLMMGVFGLMIAMIVNIFMHSMQMQWIVSVLGVVIFTGLTAFNVQQIKQTYASGWGSETNDKLAVFGALQLYLNFINAFQFLLTLSGNRR
jgi:FtsH-binding integral membrane protein